MGYRSEVRCLIWGSEEKMGAFLVENRLIIPHPAFQHFKDSLKSYVVEAAIEFDDDTQTIPTKTYQILDLYGDYWKWYESYSDVQSWVSLMDTAKEAGLDVYFIRIGEGDGDDQDVESYCTTDAFPFLSVGRPTIEEDIPEPIKVIDL